MAKGKSGGSGGGKKGGGQAKQSKAAPKTPPARKTVTASYGTGGLVFGAGEQRKGNPQVKDTVKPPPPNKTGG
jgi:hypothetical protein